MFIHSYWKGNTYAFHFMLFIIKWTNLPVYSFQLERKYTRLLLCVIYFKMDQTVCLERKHTSLFIDVIYFNKSNISMMSPTFL